MIEDRKRWGFERLSIRTGNSRQRRRPLPSVGGQVWGVSIRWVNQYVKDGRVPGAERLGRAWAIPESAVKPEKQKSGPKSKTSIVCSVAEHLT